MDPAQFQQFMTQDYASKEAQLELLRGQSKQNKESQDRQKAESQAKKIQGCDGSTTKKLRQWFKAIEITIPYSNRTVYIAALSAEGPLRNELERYLASLVDRNTATWQNLKTHLTSQFLSSHEDERLRDEVDKVVQESYELTSNYGRRFRDAVDVAYPAAGRNADQQRIMLRAYMRGLKDKELVGRLVQEGRPADYVDAMELVTKYESDKYNLDKALNGVVAETRREEPMEVAAMAEAGAPSKTESEILKQLSSMHRQVSGLSREFTRMKAGDAHAVSRSSAPAARAQRPQVSRPVLPPSGQRPRPSFQYTADGRPICAQCKKPGHFRRECRSRSNSDSRNRIASMPPGGY